MTTEQRRKDISFPLLCCSFAVILALASLFAGFGNRWGWWGFRTGLTILRWTASAEVATAALALVCCFLPATRKSGKALSLFLIALVISLAAASVPVRMWMIFRSVPKIHDITTDTDNPPRFYALLKLRKDALNPVTYGGQEIAEQQHKAYPDLAPLVLDLPPDKAFERSLSAAKKLSWTIISADEGKGLIEATDTTFWFGFTDDIVIRISPKGKGSRIDLRSLSWVGKSDVGTNAKRIRTFMKTVKDQ
jgi:uncharacterized protein (DUF1499 family)